LADPSGNSVDAIVEQVEHAECRDRSTDDFALAEVIVDGRRIADPVERDGVHPS